MDDDNFEAECDRLSRVIDPKGAEEREWAATGGGLIDEAVRFAQLAFEPRPDLFLVEAPSIDRKRFFTIATAQTGGIDIVKIGFNAQGSSVIIWAENLPSSPAATILKKHFDIEGRLLNGVWVKSVLAQILASVEPR